MRREAAGERAPAASEFFSPGRVALAPPARELPAGRERRLAALYGERWRVTEHSIKGNPDRLQTWPVEIRLDDRWKSELPPRTQRLVTALTWPLLVRDGYLGG